MSILLRTSRNIPRTLLKSPIVQFSGRRKMATAAPAKKFEWLVILPDQEGKFAKRMEVRPTHFGGIQASRESGFMKTGGALLSEVPKEGEALKIIGSMVVVEGETKEEVIEKLKEDIYAKSEVWDFEKAQIYPFLPAFRAALN